MITVCHPAIHTAVGPYQLCGGHTGGSQPDQGRIPLNRRRSNTVNIAYRITYANGLNNVRTALSLKTIQNVGKKLVGTSTRTLDLLIKSHLADID